MVESILRRFFTVYVVRKEHNAVSRVEQTDRKDEVQFPDRIFKLAWRCSHMITRDELVNVYVYGLNTAVFQIVDHQVRHFVHGD